MDVFALCCVLPEGMPDMWCASLMLVVPQDTEGCRRCSQLQHLAHEPRPVPGASYGCGAVQVLSKVHCHNHF
jgi:hypothetical protein